MYKLSSVREWNTLRPHIFYGFTFSICSSATMRHGTHKMYIFVHQLWSALFNLIAWRGCRRHTIVSNLYNTYIKYMNVHWRTTEKMRHAEPNDDKLTHYLQNGYVWAPYTWYKSSLSLSLSRRSPIIHRISSFSLNCPCCLFVPPPPLKRCKRGGRGVRWLW